MVAAALGFNVRGMVFVAPVAPTAGGLTVERFRGAKAQDQGLLQRLEACGDRLRCCRH